MSSEPKPNSPGRCIIVSAPSGAGKTTIVKHMMATIDSLDFSISATSRAPRGQEKEGVDYYYLSVEEFQQKITNDEFIEWEEVYEKQYYGTLKSEITRIWMSGKQVVFDVDVLGGLNLKKHFGDQALALFIEPPSMAALEERLRLRGTDSEESILERIAKAEEEMAVNAGFDVIIVNDKLQLACDMVVGVVRGFLGR